MDPLEFLSKLFSCLTRSEPIESRLHSALDLIRQFFALEAAAILFVPEQRHDFRAISSGDRPGLMDEYRDRYFYLDPYHDLAEDRVTLFNPARDPGDGITVEFRRFCIRAGVGAVAGADFRLNRTLEIRLRCCRASCQDEFTPAEVRLLDRVLPHLRDAIEQTFLHQCRSLFDRSAHKVLARFHIGIVVVNRALEVIEKSRFADELLLKTGALICNRNRLMARSKEYQTRIEAMVEELASHEASLYRTLSLPAPRGGEACTLAMAREDGLAQALLFGEPRYALYIFSQLEDSVDMSMLVKLWNISPAEQRILSAIMQFDNVKKVAMELHISPNTAKAQLKSVYRKLGIVSKTMLIRRLNTVRNMTALLG